LVQTIQIGHPSEQVVGALFSDLKVELCTPCQIEPIDGIYISEVLFADDTLISEAQVHAASTYCYMQLKDILNISD
jgi:hypothetical protein